MREVQLFIKPEGSADYLKVDLFDDEIISLTQTIKNSQDVSKVFTDFSRSFTVPASKVNNTIFKHYHRYGIDNGFDGRKRVDARIEINRVPFKIGRVRLDGVQLKDDKAYAYKLTFFGNTIKLRDAIGEEKLGSLELSDYNTTYNATNIKAGLSANPATEHLIVPLITHSQRMTYGTGLDTDIKADASVDHGVFWSEFKYAIRVHKIVEAIADRYGFTFSNDSFFSTSNANYYNLFLWLHRKKGDLQSDILETPSYSLFNLQNGNTNPTRFAWMRTDGAQLYINETRYLTGLQLRIENTNGLTYSVSVRRDGEERMSRLNVTDSVLDLNLLGEAREGSAYEVYISATPSDSLYVKWTATLQEPFNPPDPLSFDGTRTVGDDPAFNISEQIPEMKVMDFLSGLFKMFNLVAEVDEQNVVTVKELNTYYSEGIFRDITQYVDNTTADVDVAIPYSEIEYKYKSSKTILADQYNQIRNKEWGADSYNTEDNLKEGEKFTVEIPFEHVQFERLNDVSTGVATNIMYGYYVDDNQDPYIGAPLIFYPILNSLGDNEISFVTSKDANGNFDARDIISSTSVNIPSNSLTKDGAGEQLDNLHFYLEGNEYSPNTEFYKTLFYNYHFNYIASLFNFRNRMSKFRAILPMNVLINLSLADTILIQGNRYRINSINTNLNTGESNLELLNVIPAYALTGAGEAGGSEGTGSGGGGGEVDTLFASISGERNPTEGTSHVYSSTVTGTATGTTAYQWSVSNGGTIVGSSTNANVEISWAEVSADSIRTISLTVTRNNDGDPKSFTTQPYQVTVEDGTPAPTPLTIDILQSGATPEDAVSEGALRIYDAALYGDYDTPVTYTWAADGGTITGGQGTSRVYITWNEIPGDTGTDYNGSVSLTVVSDDGQTPPTKSYPVRVVDGTTAPYINITMTNVSPSVELGYTTTYGSIIDSNITTSNPDIYSWSITGGTINSGQFSSSANVTWDTPGTGTISVSVTREGESDTDANNIEVIEYYTTAEITGDFTAVPEGTTRTYGSSIGGNTSGEISYTWSATRGEISGGSYDGNGNSVISGVGLSSVDVTWGIYELGQGNLSLTATRGGYSGSDNSPIEIVGIYYVFNACDGGETIISRFGRVPDYVGGQGETFVDYSGPNPIYYEYANSFVNSTAGWTVKSLQAYEISGVQQFGCPSEPPPPERYISISGPTTAPTAGGTETYTITTDPSDMGWTLSDSALSVFNPIDITLSLTAGVGTTDVDVTFGAYNGSNQETLYSQIRVDDDSSEIFSTVEVSQSPPPPTTYYIFEACDPANWADVMIESATVPATNERAVGGFSNYYTYANATTTDENAYPIATLTLEGVTGCPEPPNCTRYEAFNEGSSTTYFIYTDCTSGGNRLLDVTPGQTRSVCAVNDTFEYVSGDTNYTISILGSC